MSNRSDYDDGEWQLLRDVPARAGAAIMALAETGPLGEMAEIRALARGEGAARLLFPGVELIQALYEDEDLEMQREQASTVEEAPPASPQDAIDRAVAECAQVRAVLEARATPEEIDAYRVWVMGTAEAVTFASREGGFLGIGGQLVTEAEHALLGRLGAGLGYAAYTAPPVG